MSYSGHSNTHVGNLLSAVTDALLMGEHNLDRLVERYSVPRQEIEGALLLIHRLNQTLTFVQPSRRFTRRLKYDLVGAPSSGVINRVRYLPPRVQIAAGVALLAGFMLLTRRRMTADGRADATTPELPVLQ